MKLQYSPMSLSPIKSIQRYISISIHFKREKFSTKYHNGF